MEYWRSRGGMPWCLWIGKPHDIHRPPFGGHLLQRRILVSGFK